MLKDKLAIYLSRNDLSKKAIKEIISILAEYDYSSDETIEELVEILYTFKSDVIYGFVCESFYKVSEEKLHLFVELCKKAINPHKFTHAFCLVISLYRQSRKLEAEEIVAFLIENYVFSKKINKQIFISFERAMHYEGAECLLNTCIEDDRTKNGYRNLLIGFLEMYPKSDYAKGVKGWFDLNNVAVHGSEQEIISFALKSDSNEKINAEVPSDSGGADMNGEGVAEAVTLPEQNKNQESVQEVKNNQLDLTKISITQLLEVANTQVLQLYERISAVEAENKKLKENGTLLSERLKSCELSLKSAENMATSLHGEIVTRDSTIFELRRELATATNKIGELSGKLEELNSKLSNVESAYGHAGQQEIEYLKGEIRKRLSSEYSKYTELKEKAPDLDYYNILLDMLDEIYYVLGKNGIKFN